MTIEIHPTSTPFSAGETLMLVVQGASILPWEVAIGFEEKINRGRHNIHSGGEHDSYLSAPVNRTGELRCRMTYFSCRATELAPR